MSLLKSLITVLASVGLLQIAGCLPEPVLLDEQIAIFVSDFARQALAAAVL